MLEQELKDIWSNSSQTTQISINKNLLKIELNKKVDDMQNTIQIRDRREILSSVIGIVGFGYLFYEIPFLVTKVSCVLSILWFLYVIFKFRKSKHQNTKPDLSLPIKEQLEHQKASMQYQANLLNSIAYWYAIPPFIINVIFIIGLGNPAEYNWTNKITENILPLSISLKVGILIGLTLFYTLIIWLNKRAVRKGIDPLIKSLNSMLEEFKNK